MKNLYLYIMAFLALAACSADPELGPIITIDNAEIGAFPRTVNLVSGEYDLMDKSGSSYVHDIDFRSEDGGANVSEYRLFLAYADNDASNGDDSFAEALFKTYTQSDFSDGPDGNKALTLDFPFSEVAAFAGANLDNISAGDQFRFRAELELADGRVFTASNTESTIFGPAFRAFFDFNVNATCPLGEDKWVGTYAITHEDGPNNPWGTGVREANVELALVPGSTTVRAINGVVVIDAFGGFEMAASVEFVCTTARWVDANPGVGCGAAGIFYNGGAPTEGVDIADDATLVLTIEEDGGDCGYSNTDVIRLTKQ